MRFFTTAQLGAKRSLTPEGFLVCHDVPIARVGQQIYAAYEVPVDANMVGEIFIDRPAEEVFREETVASFAGKPVTIDHPSEFVGPDNWHALSKGIVLNPRAGAGLDQDVILADLLITGRDAIKLVTDDDIREVSAGYEADYEQIEPGRGVQRNIIANHVALVAMGRCGSRCAIGDENMAKKPTWLDRVRSAFKSKDEAAMEEALKEAPTSDADEDDEDEKAKTGDSVVKLTIDSAVLDTLTKSIAALDAKVAALATKDSDKEDEECKTEDSDDDDEDDGKTKDAAAKRFRDAVARAEIIAPGLRLPTTDAKATAKAMDAAVCSCQRKALATAYATDAGKQAIEPFLGGAEATFDTMDPAALQTVFVGASELMRAKNNAGGVRPGVTTQDFGRAPVKTADLNAKNRAFWNPKQAS
ncbi:MAG: hypothetical protein C0458_05520 [Methylobacterium sp.]|nr:hypothetical protein [Methylobacterium sp.]